jgi:putative phage-type endonuclease
VKTYLQLVQGSPEWLEHRKKYRNASETPAVMGVSPWVKPEQLRAYRSGEKTQYVNPAMKHGMALEPLARAVYEGETGLVLEPCVMVDGLYSASLDGITFEEDIILEIKCPMKGKASETWQEVASGRVPEHYYWQIQHQLMISGAERCDLWVFDGMEGVVMPVEPCPEDMCRLVTAWDAFIELEVVS